MPLPEAHWLSLHPFDTRSCRAEGMRRFVSLALVGHRTPSALVPGADTSALQQLFTRDNP